MERSQTIRRYIAAILTVMLVFAAMPIQVIAEKNDHTITVSSENGLIEKAAKPKSIKITGSGYVAKGKKITLKATVSPASASQKVTWKSANKKIATVSSSGVVKGIKSGKVKITATSKANKKIKKTFTVEVKAAAVTSIVISGAMNLDLAGTKTVTLKAKATPSSAAQSFTWKSSNPKVATISSKGKVTAKAVGTVKITATATDGSRKKASVTIKVTKASADTELFGILSRYTFIMSSGAGAWADTMKIKANGTYTGEYYDADMGDVGEDYPNGTVYIGTYSGKLGNVRKYNKYLYKVKVIRQKMDDRPAEEIIDGVRYVSTGGGLPAGEDVFVCVPGTPFSQIPEEAQMWFTGPTGNWDMTETESYGIFTQDGSCGFIHW